jgi:hypothetical protein
MEKDIKLVAWHYADIVKGSVVEEMCADYIETCFIPHSGILWPMTLLPDNNVIPCVMEGAHLGALILQTAV